MALSDLKIGEIAVIKKLSVDAMLASRLHAMGLRTESLIRLIRRAPFSGPLHVRIRSTDVVINLNISKLIEVEIV